MHVHELVVDGLRLHIRETGEASAPPVVVLHGIMGHSREWDTMLESVRHLARLVVVDQRGHGQSDWASDYSIPALSGDIAAVIRRLGLEAPIVVGHSLGGMVGMDLAAEHPELVGGLVLIDITPDAITPEAATGLAAFVGGLADSAYSSIEEAMRPWLAGNPLARLDLLRNYVEHGVRRRDDGRLVWCFDGTGLARFPHQVSPAALWEAVERITAPTLLIRGEHSPFVSEAAGRLLVSRTGSGRLVVIEGGGHDLGVERPEAVGDAVAGFLRDVRLQTVSR